MTISGEPSPGPLGSPEATSGGGDDDLTLKMLMALSLLIDAALTAEHTAVEASKVVPFPP